MGVARIVTIRNVVDIDVFRPLPKDERLLRELNLSPAGAKTRKSVIPPNLEVLAEKPQVIQIKVSIYRKDNQELIGEDTCPIQMVA